MITNIIENLQLKINNVHLRYEDDTSINGQNFACGLLIEVSGHRPDKPCSRFITLPSSSFRVYRLKAQMKPGHQSMSAVILQM